jgi:hypothetical protein
MSGRRKRTRAVAKKTARDESARPAPFSPDQVAQLTAGGADQKMVGKVLAAHRQPRLPTAERTRASASTPSPITVSAAELRELATGALPEDVSARLEASTSTRRRSTGKARKGAIKPSRRPPN